MCNPNNSHTSSNFYLPTLYELLEHTTNLDSHKSNQSLLSFHEYLMSRHCSENLQFIIDINKYLFTHNSTNSSCNSGLVNLWNFIYEKYLTFDADLEINLPCRLKSQLKLNQLPELNVLKNCQKYIYDNLLISLYREFTKLMKQQYDKEMKKKKQQQQEQEQEEKQLKQQKSISEQSSPINKNNNNGSSSSSSNSTGSFTHFKHSLSLNLPRRNSNKICNNKNNQHIKHIDDDDDENICPISKVNTSISTEKEEEKEETENVHHRKQHFIGYDYYTIPTIESTSSSSSSSSSSSPTYFDNQNHNNSTHHHHNHNHNEEKDCFVINDNNYFTTWSMNRNNSSSSGTTSGTTTRTNSTSTRHNSSSGNSSGSSNNTSRGSSIGSIFMDNSIQYFNNKMKKFKFGSN